MNYFFILQIFNGTFVFITLKKIKIFEIRLKKKMYWTFWTFTVSQYNDGTHPKNNVVAA